MNFKGWKKTHNAEDHAVFTNEKGHQLKISKKTLSPKLRADMEAIELHDGGNPKLEESKKQPPAVKMAEGGQLDIEEIPQDKLDVEPLSAQESAASLQPPDKEVDLNQPMDNAGQQVAPMPEAAAQPAMAADQNPAQTMQTNPEAQQSGIDQLPGVMGQKAAAAAEAQAIGEQGARDVKTLEKANREQVNHVKNFQKSYNDILKESHALLDDAKNGHIDPQAYWKDHNKTMTAIGLVLGGFNPHGNGALDFLNKQMDRNLEAQRAEMGHKNNLLAAYVHQLGSMKDGEDMFRLATSNIVANQLKISAAKAQDPIAKARALGIAAKIDSDHAMLAQQMAMRQTLAKGASQGQDPSSFVPWLVPKEQQQAVFKEIERAQNTSHMGENIMKAFDDAAKENTVMRTGAGLLRTPASVYALHQHMQPTFQDLEGTVRQAAMDNTFKNITPMPGDKQYTIDTKRHALEEYIKAKSSAPTAKGFGIDLSQFGTTSPDRAMRLSPEAQADVAWARKNPDNPLAATVFKKYGVK